MRSVRLLALIAILAGVASVHAQDNFPDVPKNHWAYEALDRMKKEGLLVGYPDGLFRGGRPTSRYELAVAAHAVYAKLREEIFGIDAQIQALKPGGFTGSYTTQADVTAMKDAIAALQSDLLKMKGYGADIADLRRASDTFEFELTQLGVDVQAMKDDLLDLAGRVRTLEGKRPAVEISGDLSLWAGGGHGAHELYGLTRDARLTGVGDKSTQGNLFPPVPNRSGITDDFAALQEAAVTLTTSNPKGVRFTGTFVATNAFGQAIVNGVPTSNIGFGNQSDVFSPAYGDAGTAGFFGYADGIGDVYAQELAAQFSGSRFDVEAGRIRHKSNPWIFQRIDNTSYFDNARWDDGKYTLDGLIARSHLGRVDFEAFAGRDSSVNSVKGVRINPLRSGAINGPIFVPGFATGIGDAQRLEADETLGGTISTSIKGVALRGDYLRLHASRQLLGDFGTLDTIDAYGGQANFGIGRFKVEGGLRQTAARGLDGHIHGLSDSAWDAKVGFASGRFDLSAGYRQVGLNYLAPGDWGRLGVIRNPTNVRGFLGTAKVALAPRYSLGLEGEISHGLEDDDASGTALGRDTDISRYVVRFDANLTKGFGAYARYERTGFSDLRGDAVLGSPQYQWYGLGLTHGLGGNALFSLSYEQSAISNDYQTNDATGGTSFRGGFLTSQVTVKF